VQDVLYRWRTALHAGYLKTSYEELSGIWYIFSAQRIKLKSRLNLNQGLNFENKSSDTLIRPKTIEMSEPILVLVSWKVLPPRIRRDFIVRLALTGVAHFARDSKLHISEVFIRGSLHGSPIHVTVSVRVEFNAGQHYSLHVCIPSSQRGRKLSSLNLTFERYPDTGPHHQRYYNPGKVVPEVHQELWDLGTITKTYILSLIV